MPQYLGLVRIDWHVAATPDELRPILVEASARLDSTDHTYQTFNEQLSALAREQPRLVADLLIDDGWGRYVLYRLENGRVTELDPQERPEDAPDVPIDLPYDDVVGDLELEYRSEAALAAAVADAEQDDDEGSFIARAGDSRYLVEIGDGRSRIRKLVFTNHRELVERLLRADYASPPPAPRVATEKYELALFFPGSMLREIQQAATRTDHSLSYIVQLAWKTAYPTIAKSDRDALPSRERSTAAGETRKQTLYVSGAMADQIEAEAARLDASSSFVVQTAFVMAREEIEKLPTVSGVSAT